MPFDRALFVALVPGPGPAPFDLDLEREAEEGPDENDAAEDEQALKRRLDRHRVDDVGGDQELEPEQDGAAHIRAIEGEGVRSGPAVQHLPEDGEARSENAQDDDRDPADLDGTRHQFQCRGKPVVHGRSFATLMDLDS